MVGFLDGIAERRPRIPVAGADGFARPARRTAVARLLLAAAILLALLFCVLLASELRTRPNSYFAGGGSGVVVTDLSSSVDPNKYRRLTRVFRTFVRTNQPLGLVVFSDSAYEVLPTGTRGEELRPILRFFEPPEQTARQSEQQRRGQGAGFLESPWSGVFRGGTRISLGLREARRMITRDGIANPTVVLVSDLDDSPFDLKPLTEEVIRYHRAGIELRIVPLFPGPDDRELFSRIAGEDAFVYNDELLRNTKLEERRSLVGAFPLGLVAVGALVLLLLAVNEHVNGRLSWRRREVHA
jgi:hypothetical protein